MERDFWEKIAKKELMKEQGIAEIIRGFYDILSTLEIITQFYI